jgi:VWFA-related protein
MKLFGPSELTLPTQAQTVSVCLTKAARWLFMLSFVVLALPAFGVAKARGLIAPPDEGISIELPGNGQLRVENQFGNIDFRVGTDRKVLVAVAFTDRGAGGRSPVVIETRQNVLSISVVPGNSEPSRQVDLKVTAPPNTRAELVTSQGRITSRGLPLSLSLNTVAGQILAELETPLDADILAQSAQGLVRSSIGSQGTDEHSYHLRSGSGQRVLRASSRRGDIIISSPAISNTGSPAPRAPELRPSSGGNPGAGTPAGQSATEEVDEGDVIRVDAQLVTLNLSVVDRATNRGMVGLTQSDFKLFENGAEQRLLQFDSSSAPFDLVLLIDLSGSTRDVVKLIRAAARRFVDAARPSDRIAIITFAGKASVVSPLTLDREALRQRVDAIDTVAGDTKLYDAGDFAMSEVARQTKNSRRAAIVLMSDGLDGSIPGVQGEGSKLPYQEFLNSVREFDGVLYTLWLNTYYEALNPQDTQPEAFDLGYDRMKDLAEAGGGMFYEVEKLEDLAGAYERVVADLGTVYSLAYRPSNKSRDGKWRSIKVTVDRNNAVARGKHGYYAN